jgi:UDP-N-acetylglucosamine transferase subunit ALG13
VIFVTVGSALPFDRLIKTVDKWASRHPEEEIFAQIGRTDYRPAHMSWVITLTPRSFQEKCSESRVIVAHAGMGTIITALEKGKPILVMPRCANMEEHVNNHQLACATWLATRKGIKIVYNESELLEGLDMLDQIPAPDIISLSGTASLIQRLKHFLLESD